MRSDSVQGETAGTKRGMEPCRSMSIQEKVEEARALHHALEGRLRQDKRIRSLLERIEQNIDARLEALHAAGVARACRRCEEQEGGSCCGAGIENRYDGIQLLINMLMGVLLPDQQTYSDSCYFLQSDGCCLKARHVLCVNYLCTKLQTGLSHADLVALQTAAGEELDTGFVLYEAVKKALGRVTGDR